MIDVVEAKIYHCGRMARLLRQEHDYHLRRCGVDLHRELRNNFNNSTWCRAGFVDGRLVGLGGVMGSELDWAGFVWLALSQEVRNHPISAARVLRGLLSEIMGTRRELATIVIPEDDAALRLAVFMGFHSEHEGEGSQASSRASRHALARYLKDNPSLRIPLGKGTCVALGYHEEQPLVSEPIQRYIS